MTSGEFTSYPIDKIWVDRENRQRRELRNVEELAASIARVGLIHPPVIERTGELRVGERRWTACKSLGWSHMPVQFVDDLLPAEAQALELEENIARLDIEWKEECLAVAKYHALRQELDPMWSPDQTGDALGMHSHSVHDKLNVAKAIMQGNPRVVEAPKFTVARGIVRRSTARAEASAIADALSSTVVDEVAPTVSTKTVPLLNEDFHAWASAYTGSPFNLLHCDFPYGIKADTHAQGAAAALGGYDDSPDVYWRLLDTLRGNMDSVVAPSAHLIFWFSMKFYSETKSRLEEMGWTVNPTPLIWWKNDNTGILPDPSRGPRQVYETAFFASRGDRLIVQAKSNVFAFPGKDKSIHMSQKPVPMLRHFMGMCVDEYSRVLDPTAGSANALKAAQALGAPTVLGLERDPEFYARSCEAYFKEEDDDLGI